MGARPVACTVCEHHAESTFAVEGMDCREEVVLLERRFKNLPGLEDFTADVMGRRLLVKYDAAKLSASAIAAAVADAGMLAWLEHEEPIVEGDRAARRRLMLIAASATAFAAGLVLEWTGQRTAFVRTAYALSIVTGASLTARR